MDDMTKTSCAGGAPEWVARKMRVFHGIEKRSAQQAQVGPGEDKLPGAKVVFGRSAPAARAIAEWRRPGFEGTASFGKKRQAKERSAGRADALRLLRRKKPSVGRAGQGGHVGCPSPPHCARRSRFSWRGKRRSGAKKGRPEKVAPDAYSGRWKRKVLR